MLEYAGHLFCKFIPTIIVREKKYNFRLYDFLSPLSFNLSVTINRTEGQDSYREKSILSSSNIYKQIKRFSLSLFLIDFFLNLV